MKKGSLLIVLAGVLWGSMGLFVRALGGYGFTSVQIAALRMVVAALVYAAILAARQPAGFRLKKRDLPLFLGLGLCSVLFFTVCYFTAIQLMSMSAAAILLYTSPVWVMLMSVVFFHEALTGRKVTALCTAFLGCVLVSGIGGAVTPMGVVFGLCSGIGYALYSILGTVALRRYAPLTVTTYTFIIASAGAVLICQPADLAAKLLNAPSLPLLAGLVLLTGLVTAVIPYLAYTAGLQTVEASHAAILATIEPMVATLLGAVVYHEAITLLSGLGVVCILGAVAVLNTKPAK